MLDELPPILLYLLSICVSIFLLLLLIAIGWFLVWKVFLSRFRFVRELVNGNSNENLPTGGNNSNAGDKENVGSGDAPVRRRAQRPRVE